MMSASAGASKSVKEVAKVEEHSTSITEWTSSALESREDEDALATNKHPSRRRSLMKRLQSTLSDPGSMVNGQEDKVLGTWSATGILVNFISVGYILNPSGKILVICMFKSCCA